MRFWILLLLFFIPVFKTYSQGNNTVPTYVKINWEVGKKVEMVQIDSTISGKNRKPILRMGSLKNITINVINKKDSIYEILFNEEIIDSLNKFNFKWNEPEITIGKMSEDLTSQLMNEVYNSEYSLLVNQNTYLAFSILNDSAIKQQAKNKIPELIKSYKKKNKFKINKSETKNLQLYLEAIIDPFSIKTMKEKMDAFNEITTPYLYPYFVKNNNKTGFEIYQVEDIPYPKMDCNAFLTMHNTLNDSVVEIELDYKVDKECAYQKQVIDKGKQAKITYENFAIVDQMNIQFDVKTSWIKRYTTTFIVVTGDIDTKVSRYRFIK